MKTILCVEDELHILRNHAKYLTGHGYAVLTADTAARAREQAAAHNPDAILLDIMLPDGNGLELLSEWRMAGIKTPIIMLTAWGKPTDISTGYLLGATAYLSKPFDYGAVLAVLEGIFRSADNVPERIKRGGLNIDMSSIQAFLNGEDLLLTQKEFALLLLFIRNEGKVMSGQYLYEKIWNAPYGEKDRTLKTHLSNLRKRIEGSGYEITTERGSGYCFNRKVEIS